MATIKIGLLDCDAKAVSFFNDALRQLEGRFAGRPIAPASGLIPTPASHEENWNGFRKAIDEHRGPLLLFVDFDLGLSSAERQSRRDEFRREFACVDSEIADELLAEEVPDGIILAMYALVKPAISPLLLVHNSRGGNADLFSTLTAFGESYRIAQSGRPDFACLHRPTNLGVTAFNHPRTTLAKVSQLIEWSVETFAKQFPTNNPLDTDSLATSWRTATTKIAASGWFGESGGTGGNGLFATAIPLGSAPGADRGSTHDLGHWDAAVFAAFDAKRALGAIAPLFAELGNTETLVPPTTLDGFWPLSCLKAMEHNLPHRSMLLAAAGRKFAGYLDSPSEHRREIRLENTENSRLLASARVLAALRVLRWEGFTADTPETFRVRGTNVFRILLTTTTKKEKLDEMVLSAVTRTTDEKRKDGHPTGGKFTLSCEWLGKHTSNFWVSRARDKRGERQLTLAIEFEEGDLQ
jgi:hypothetical protein